MGSQEWGKIKYFEDLWTMRWLVSFVENNVWSSEIGFGNAHKDEFVEFLEQQQLHHPFLIDHVLSVLGAPGLENQVQLNYIINPISSIRSMCMRNLSKCKFGEEPNKTHVWCMWRITSLRLELCRCIPNEQWFIIYKWAQPWAWLINLERLFLIRCPLGVSG